MKLPKKFYWSKHDDGFQCHGGLTHEEELYLVNLGCIISTTKQFTIVKPTKPVFDNFYSYEYMDGFSPNLNKKLHIGHFSNLVLAKAFKNLGVANKTIAIYGDTLENTDLQNKNYTNFGYKVDNEYFASKQQLIHNIMEPGVGQYKDSYCFNINTQQIVGIKTNGNTTYFYQDVALAQKLNNTTLYLTAYEQTQHFIDLKMLFPHINHIGLGLVKANNIKMSSRDGNVLFMSDILKLLVDEFSDIDIAYNIFAGYILSVNPKTDKHIDMSSLTNYDVSKGLYVSYVMAKLNNLPITYTTEFNMDPKLWFHYLHAKSTLNPSLLFNALIDYCKNINTLYHSISSTNFVPGYNDMYNNLIYFSEKLGLFNIKHIKKRNELNAQIPSSIV